MANHLPRRLQKWWELSVMASNLHMVDACLILAVMDRESLGGEALRPKGAAGTGDWTPRHWSRYAEAEEEVRRRVRHWQPTQEEYARHIKRPFEGQPPEICMPIDGQGFGRGLMQLDWMAPANFEFLDTEHPRGGPAWANPWRNISAGAELLGKRLRQFDGDTFLAAAAYNAGPGAVSAVLRNLTTPSSDEARHAAADKVTTGDNYASDVVGRMRNLRQMLALTYHELSEEG
jgi:hypothetical protein